MTKPANAPRDIFDQALQIDSVGERNRYLAEVCGTDTALRSEVASLLLAFDSAGNFLENAFVSATQVEGPGALIGPYKLLEKIGEGGMGIVYMAEQSQPIKRKVALKIIKPGMNSRQVIARFEAERQALAMMDHPNIAKVLDAGATGSSRPYFVMELVKGIAITDYCDQAQLAPTERLALFAKVCQATHHAHQKGIIHRDLKPSNVLVSLYDGTPVPKIIDFGVAKAIDQRLTESTLFTQHGAIVGTLEYMSPEQAENSSIDIDTRTDVYALGVLLFELLTGSTPLDHQRLKQAKYSEVLRRIREEDPPSLSSRLSKTEQIVAIATQRNTEPAKLARLVRGELDWITMKALAKDRQRRYETANDLARDIQRYLVGQPVEAAPPSTSYLVQKYASKHRAALTTAAAFVTVLVAATVISTWQAIRATREELKAKTSESQTKAVLKFFSKSVLAAARPKGRQGGLGYDVSLHAAIDAAEPTIAVDFAGQPVVEASIRDALGTTYLYLGESAQAIPQHKRAWELRSAEIGFDDADTLATMNNLAVAYRIAGRFADAVPLHELELCITEAKKGREHAATLTSISNLAVAYRLAGRLNEAIPLFEEVLACRRAKLGLSNPDTLISLNNLAVAYRRVGRTAEAVALHEEDLEQSRTNLGPEHPDTATAMANLAGAYLELGQLEKALPLFEKSLELRRSNIGAEHPDFVATRSDRAIAYQVAGRFPEAAREFKEVLAWRKANLAPDHPDTLKSMNNLALALRETGQSAAAASMLEDTLKRRQAKLGADHPDTLKNMNDLATLFLEANQWGKTETLLRECLKLRELKGNDDWRHFQTMSQLGAALAGLNQLAEAEPMLIKGCDGMKSRESTIPFPRKNELAAAIGRVVAFYEARADSERAARRRQQLAPLAKTNHPVD